MMLRIVIKKIRNYKDNKWGDNRMAGGGGGWWEQRHGGREGKRRVITHCNLVFQPLTISGAAKTTTTTTRAQNILPRHKQIIFVSTQSQLSWPFLSSSQIAGWLVGWLGHGRRRAMGGRKTGGRGKTFPREFPGFWAKKTDRYRASWTCLKRLN